MNNMLCFESLEETITEKDILKFEKKFKVKLPEDYKNFLLKYNGGIVNADIFVNKKRKRINPLKIKRETGCSVGVIFSLEEVKLSKNVAIEIEELPPNIFSIAHDSGGGDYICISLNGEDKGCIYYASHEEPHDNYDNMFHLADSFTEFLNGLVPFEKE